MKKDSPSLLACVSRTFKVHFWDNLMAASHLGLQGLLRLCSGRRRHRRPAARPGWSGRFLPAMEMLEPRLQPAGLPTFYPTGVDNSGALLGTGVTDPHYAIVARPWPLTDMTSRTVTPAAGWVANDSDSRWITPTSSGFQGVNIGGYYTYRTTVDFTGYAPGSIVLSGKWAADDFAVITVNGSPTPSAAIYYPAWGSLQSFTLDYSNSTFFSGVNTIDFTVGNYYNSTGLRVDHVSVQASQQRGSDPERALRVPVGQAEVDLNTGSLRVQQPLDFDQSPGTGVGGSPALAYNSSTVSVKPIVETLVNTSLGMPAATSIQVTLTINGGTPTVQTFTPTGPAGSSYVLAVQDSTAITDTDRYPYSVDVQVTYTGGGVVTAPTVNGNVNVVARDSSPYGAGWGIAGVDALITATVSGDGVLWVTGAGDSRFFAFNGSGGFISPAEDFGTLAVSGGTYTYTGTDGTQWKFNSSGQLANVVTPDTRTTTYSYTSTSGPLQEVDSSDGGVTTLAYSSALATIYESGGRTVSTSVNGGSGELDSLTDENGETRGFSYGSGHRLSQDQWSPLDAAFAYDAYGLVTSVDRGLGGVYGVAAAVGKPLVPSPALGAGAQGLATLSDPLSHTTTYTLDSRGRETTETAADGSVQSWTRNSSGQPLVYTDPLTRQTQYAYSATGYSGYHPQGGDLTTITYADGTQDRYSYNTTFHKPVSHTDRKSRTTNYSYTAAGLLTVVTDALSNVTTYLLDGSGNVTQMIDAKSSATYFAYDGGNRLVERTDALGGITTLIYDSVGNATVAIDALGRAVTTLYDGQGNVTSVTRPGGLTATMVYDAIGNVIDETNELSQQTTYAYDQQGRLAFTAQAAETFSPETSYNYYDAAGNLTGVWDEESHWTTYTYDLVNRWTSTTVSTTAGLSTDTTYYDLAGNVTGTRNANSRLTAYLYDVNNRATATIDALNQPSYSYFDAVGNITLAVDEAGRRTTYTVDGLNRVTVTTIPAGSSYTFFDKVGNVTGTKDADGRLTTYTVDAINRVTMTSVNTAAGLATSYTFYDKVSNVTGTRDANSRDTGYLYDQLDRQTGVVQPVAFAISSAGRASPSTDIVVTSAGHGLLDGSTVSISGSGFAQANGVWTVTVLDDDEFSLDGSSDVTTGSSGGGQWRGVFRTLYDDFGNVTQTIDAKGHVTLYMLDEFNRVTVTTVAVGTDEEASSYTYYDDLGNVVGTEDAKNNETSYLLDGDNRVTMTIAAVGSSVQATSYTYYDLEGNVTGTRDANTILTSYFPDYENRVTMTKVAVGTAAQATSYTYFDAAGNVTGMRDGRNTLTAYTLDGSGRVTISTTAGATTYTFYNNAGNVVAVKDANTNFTTYAYDGDGRLTMTLNGLNKPSYTYYDLSGNVTGVKDANNALTAYALDAASRVTMTTTAAGSTYNYYDVVGNLIAFEDANSNVTSYLYDGQNRLYETQDARGNYTTQLFDAVGNLTSMEDGDNNVSTFDYDELNRKIDMTDPLGTATFTYYAGGELKSATDRLGRRRDFAYDGQSRLTTETWFATVTDTLALATMTASYDENGNQLTAANAAGIYTMQYDALDRVTGVLAPFSTRLTFSYDAVGNRTVVQDSKGGIETSIFDKADQLVTRTLGLSGKTLQAEFSYRDNGLVQKQTRKNNTGGGLNLAGTTSYLYDGANRVTAIDGYDAGTVLRTSFVYNYDGVNLTSKVDNGTATTYSYLADNQLEADGTQTFTLDEAGNRTNGPGGAYGVASANRMTSSQGGVWEYRYDAEGNQTATLSNSNSTWWTYGYDHRNQLTSAKKWNANPEVPGTPLVTKGVDYNYDWYGNRVQTDVDNDGDSDIDSTEKYALDYWNGSGFANVWADLDSGSSLTTRYLRGDGADELLGRANSSGTPSWLHTDHLGSVRNVTDSTGALTLTVTYDAWGNTSDTGGVAGRYQWTGRERDVETGLQYNRARWYDATTGRWLSQDPLGFDAGDSNLYRYVRNRQTGATDPSGLQVGPNYGPNYAEKEREIFANYAAWKQRQELLQIYPDYYSQGGSGSHPARAGLDVGKALKKLMQKVENDFHKLTVEQKVDLAKGFSRGTGALESWDIEQFYDTEKKPESDLPWVKGEWGKGELKKYVTVNGEVHFAGAVNYILWGKLNRMVHDMVFDKKGLPEAKDAGLDFSVAIGGNQDLRIMPNGHPSLPQPGHYDFTEARAIKLMEMYRTMFHSGKGIPERAAWTKVGYTDDYSIATPFRITDIVPCKEEYNGTFDVRVWGQDVQWWPMDKNPVTPNPRGGW